MKKLIALILAGLGVTAFSSADAAFFSPTNFTLKVGLGSSLKDRNVQGTGVTYSGKRFNPSVGLEVDYGLFYNAILFAGVSYTNLNATKRQPSGNTVDATLQTIKYNLAIAAVYSGIRYSFNPQSANNFYATAAIGGNLNTLAISGLTRSSTTKTKGSVYTQLGLGVIYKSLSFEFNYVPFRNLEIADKTNTYKLTTSPVIVSVGYTF